MFKEILHLIIANSGNEKIASTITVNMWIQT